MSDCLVSLSLFTWKRTRYVPHGYKKSPSDLSDFGLFHVRFQKFWVPRKFPLSPTTNLYFQFCWKHWCPYAWCLATWRVAESFMCPIPGEFAMNSTQPSFPLHWCCAWSLLSLHDYMFVCVGNEDWSLFSLISWTLKDYKTSNIHAA